ncbi:MAG: glycosyltransferase family protein [Bacteroidota bacterium]
MTNTLKYMFIIQGEGRGHLTQAIRLKQILEGEGHTLDSVFFGVNPQRNFPGYLFDEFSKDICFFRSPNFVFKKNRKGIRLSATLLHNFLRFPVFIKSILKIKDAINQQKPDVVVNFYDMLGGMAYFLSNRKPEFYAISHHFLFEHPDFPVPDDFFLQKRLMIIHNRFAALKAKKRIALSFKLQNSFRNTRILPPIIRSDIINAKPVNEGFILVYLLNEGLAADLWNIFRNNPDINFHLFYKSEKLKLTFPDNVKAKELNFQTFADSLVRCRGIICSAGFETVCEAAYLGKPVFLIPSENHYEQHGNLNDATGAGIAKHYEDFDPNISPKKNEEFRSWCNMGISDLSDLFISEHNS